MLPCIFTGKQDKEQEAESSLGICGLNLEASQASGSLRNRLCKRGMIVSWFPPPPPPPLGCNFDLLYTKGIWTCLLLSSLALLALPWVREAGWLCIRSRKHINLGVYNTKKLHSYSCWGVSKLLFPGEELICFAVICPGGDGDWVICVGPGTLLLVFKHFFLLEINRTIICFGIWGNRGKMRLQQMFGAGLGIKMI